MDPLRFLAEVNGFFTRAQAREMGYDDRQVAAAVRHQLWRRVRRGYYSFPDLVDDLKPEQHHLLMCRIVLDSIGPGVALSHVSAVVAFGLPVWGVDLRHVHLTRLDGGAGRLEAGVVHHEGFVADGELTVAQGLPCVLPARALVEAASRTTSESALCLFDTGLNAQLVDHDQLMSQFSLMARWPFVRHLHVPVRMADGGAASIGESRGRWLFWGTGIPAPVVQFAVHDENGVLRGTCDWGWPRHGLLGEFDGRVKYARLLKPGQDPGDVVFAEKTREDELREITGYAMVRLTWRDLELPRVTADRVRRRMNRAG